MTIGQMSKAGLLTLVMAATAACGRPPVMPLPGAPGTSLQAAGFVDNDLMAGDITIVKQLMAKQQPGFTVTSVTGHYLRLGFQYTARGTLADGQPKTVSGTWLPSANAGVNAAPTTAAPSQQAAVEKALKAAFILSGITVQSVQPVPGSVTTLQVEAQVSTRMSTRVGYEWTLYAVSATYDTQNAKLTILKRTLISSTKEPFGI